MGTQTDATIFILMIFLILMSVIFFIFQGRLSEDDWIKSKNGVWIKHGKPSTMPNYVYQQQNAINCSAELYNSAKNSGMNFSSQCLGRCSSYSVDIVHVPRIDDDNLYSNTCQDYPDKTPNFIELDSSGNIVRIRD